MQRLENYSQSREYALEVILVIQKSDDLTVSTSHQCSQQLTTSNYALGRQDAVRYDLQGGYIDNQKGDMTYSIYKDLSCEIK